jgi:hypothetical protein
LATTTQEGLPAAPRRRLTGRVVNLSFTTVISVVLLAVENFHLSLNLGWADAGRAVDVLAVQLGKGQSFPGERALLRPERGRPSDLASAAAARCPAMRSDQFTGPDETAPAGVHARRVVQL